MQRDKSRGFGNDRSRRNSLLDPNPLQKPALSASGLPSESRSSTLFYRSHGVKAHWHISTYMLFVRMVYKSVPWHRESRHACTLNELLTPHLADRDPQKSGMTTKPPNDFAHARPACASAGSVTEPLHS